MGIYNLCIIDKAGKLLFSYYLLPATVDEQDKWEAILSKETAPYLDACFRQDCPVGMEGKYVIMRGKYDMIFILTGVDDHDELALVDIMDHVIKCVQATCDGRLTAAQVLSFHGKLCVCIQEMLFGGELVHDDVETVLRNAKLKPPKV